MMNWVTEAIFYHIYPLGFCGAPQKNEGGEAQNRIEKLVEWLPHLQALGMNALYLGPVFESGEHGYDTNDYNLIDRRLGNNEQFAAVCKKLREGGVRVVLDGVFNHVGRDFWAFRDVREHGQQSRYCGWFENLNFGGSSPCGDPFWYEGWRGHYNLVKLNLKNPEVVAHLLDAVGGWMDKFGIDGLRLDAADCVDADFFRQLRSYCKQKNPDFWLMGEIIHGDYNRWANPEMLDSVTNYECAKGLYSSHNDHNYFEIAHSIERQSGPGGIYKQLCLYNFVDNHDLSRLGSLLRDKNHLKNIYTLLYTMPGIPSVYYGSEWALEAEKRKNGPDDNLRPCLNLADFAQADGNLCAHLANLAALRAALSPLRHGTYTPALIKNEQYVFCREADGGRVYVALNLAAHAEFVEFPVAQSPLVDCLTGTRFETNDRNMKLELPAYGSRIFASEEWYARYTAPPQTFQHTAAAEAPAPVTTPESTPIAPGRYRHFKGNEYEVIGIAKHSETLEELVVYRARYGEHGLWVRPVAMFAETVERDGKRIPRFTRLDD